MKTPPKITNRTLYTYNQEIHNMSGSILEKFHAGKINQFYKDNGIRVNTLMARLTAIAEDHYKFENGQIKHIAVDGKQVPVLLPGKTTEEYNSKTNEYLDKETSITF